MKIKLRELLAGQIQDGCLRLNAAQTEDILRIIDKMEAQLDLTGELVRDLKRDLLPVLCGAEPKDWLRRLSERACAGCGQTALFDLCSACQRNEGKS